MTPSQRATLFERAIGARIPDSAKQWLLDNGFLTAPASTRFHGAYEGGLADHSLQVTRRLVKLTKQNCLKWCRPESPYIIGMLHDLCKIDQYKKLKEPDGDKRYEYVETDVKGHGDKSVIYAQNIMDLTMEENMCIAYHMGAFTDKDKWAEYTAAVKACPNVLWTHMADMLASQVDGI